MGAILQRNGVIPRLPFSYMPLMRERFRDFLLVGILYVGFYSVDLFIH